MDERRRFAPPAVGGSSLLTVFGVLCLTVFALLSLSTVLSDKRLNDKTLENISDYYAADAAAEEILAQLRRGERPEGVTAEGETYTYVCPISDTQELAVSVAVEEDGSYRILRWQAVSSVEWNPDMSLDLWLG